MIDRGILLCGGTGELGGEIARHLSARAIPFRALVRPTTDAVELETLGAEVVRGDLRDAASLVPAVAGIGTVISTANSMARQLEGARNLTIRDVDERGYENLIAACEAAGVDRFVFASALGDFEAARTPFTDAKVATEARLRGSKLHEVIVRADMFQEVWFSPIVGFDWPHGKVTIYGEGRSHHAYVALGDVADAIVRLALATDPPCSIEIAGPEALSRQEAVEAFERVLRRPIRTRHIPRVALRIGRTLMARPRPALASVMGMALEADLSDTLVRDEGLRSLGIEARPVGRYIEEVAGSAARAAAPA